MTENAYFRLLPRPSNARRLSENGYFPQSLCQAQIIILEILKCIPVVIIFAFLDLEKNSSFSDSLLVSSTFRKLAQRADKGKFCRLYHKLLSRLLRISAQETEG